MRPSIYFSLLLFFIVVLIACAPQQTELPLSTVNLTPFLTSTQSPSQTPAGLVTAETPLPTSTPFTYTVQAGDTISGIALKFGVSIDDLQAANPETAPNAMSIGTVLNIPSNPENPSGEPTPTPAPLTIQQVECYPVINKGMWCFVLVHNDFPDLMENVSAQVTLVDPNNETLASQTALLPLNILPPNTSLPLAVFFSPEIPITARPQVQVLTAIRLLPNDQRYLPATIHNTFVQVDADGHSAKVSGQVLSQSGSVDATQVWVAATGYDDEDRVVGFRRWESSAALPARGSLPFELMISSTGGRISWVEFAVEARP